ncbi:MAG: phasin family protein, partial [Akkermansiaceae bacterium]|nr:phasin family protein [Akkermansiaceae bacterium]
MPSRERFESSGVGPCQNMVQAYFGGLDAAAQGFEPVMKGMARMQLEMIGLASRRAQAYLEVSSRLAVVRTPQDLFSEQMRFWQTAFQQYSDSSRRVMT